MSRISRRHFLGLAGTGLLAPRVSVPQGAPNKLWRITEDVIIYTQDNDRVLRTAAVEFQEFLNGLTGTHARIHWGGLGEAGWPEHAASRISFLLGTGYENALIRSLEQRGDLHTQHIPRDIDGYELRLVDGSLIVAGANTRAVHYGIHRVEEVIREGGGIPAGFHETAWPAFSSRVFHPRRWTFDYKPEDFRFLSRMGANVAHLTHDWLEEKFFHSFARSAVFPKIIEPERLDLNRRKLRMYIEQAKDYGLRVYMWICELPCQGGPWVPETTRQHFLDLFPPEALSASGTYQGKVLCFSNPLVQEHYRQLVQDFFAEFPEVEGILLFGMDSSATLCDPKLCPRCAELLRIDQRDRLIRFLVEEGRRYRPDLTVFTTNWYWDGWPAQFLEHQARLPRGSGVYCTSHTEAWSCDRHVSDMLAEARRITKRRGQVFLGYDILLSGDDTFMAAGGLLDFPLGVAAKMRRWGMLQADGVFDQWGTAPELHPANALMLRVTMWNPNADPEALARKIAVRLYGKAAAEEVCSAWREIEAADRILSENIVFWLPQRPAWFPIEIPPTPDGLAKLAEEQRQHEIDIGAQPPEGRPIVAVSRPNIKAGPVTYNQGEWSELAAQVGEAYGKVSGHLQCALNHMEAAPTRQLAVQVPLLRVHVAFSREMGYFFSAASAYARHQDSEYRAALRASAKTLPGLIAALRGARGNVYSNQKQLETWIHHAQARCKAIQDFLSA